MLWIYLALLQIVWSAPVCDMASSSVCLRPLIDAWEKIRNNETDAANILFPLPLYSKESTLALCKEYTIGLEKCEIESCKTPMTAFVKKQLGYLCGPVLPVYVDYRKCIHTAISGNKTCTEFIKGMPNPFAKEDNCDGFTKFLNCVQEPLNNCSSLAFKMARHIIVKAINGIGCGVDSALEIEAKTAFDTVNETGIYTMEYSRQLLGLDKEKNSESAEADVDASSNYEKESKAINGPAEAEEEPILTTKDSPVRPVTEAHVNSESLTTIVTHSNIATTVEHTSQLSNETESSGDGDVLESGPSSDHTTPSMKFESQTVILSENNLKDSTSSSKNENDPDATTMNPETTVEEPETTKATETCSDEDADYLGACFAHLLRRLTTMAIQSQEKQIRFPLFNVSIHSVLPLCRMYDEGVRCASAQVPRCHDTQVMQIINSQLEALCFRIDSMRRDYTCMQKVYTENPKCWIPLKGVLEEGADKCKGQQLSFDCFLEYSECQPGARILAREMIRGAGCRVDVKGWLTKKPTTTTWTPPHNWKPPTTTVDPGTNSTEIEQNSTVIISSPSAGQGVSASSSTTTTGIPYSSTPTPIILTTSAKTETKESNDISIEEVAHIPTTMATEAVTDTVHLTTIKPILQTDECPEMEREKARICVAPLMKTWIALRAGRSQLQDGSFPIYKYTRVELLELCDGYANAFLCAGVLTIKSCLKDELVRFTQDHLGYQCSPQNIARFMKHYDCIQEIEAAGNCREFNQGETLPGKDGDKCHGVPGYAACMLPLITNKCEQGAVWEFQQTIQQFGCALQLKH